MINDFERDVNGKIIPLLDILKNQFPDVKKGDKFYYFSGNMQNVSTDKNIPCLTKCQYRRNILDVVIDFKFEYECSKDADVTRHFIIFGLYVIDNTSCKYARLYEDFRGHTYIDSHEKCFQSDVDEINRLMAYDYAELQKRKSALALPAPTEKTLVQNNRKINNLSQNFSLFPAEWLAQPRFFLVKRADKAAFTKWTLADNEFYLTDLKVPDDKLVAFNLCGEGRKDKFTADYLTVDFDNVLDATTGEWINEDAKKIFRKIMPFEGTYCERSISGTGLHIYFKPPKGVFEKLKGLKNGINFTPNLPIKQAAKMEVYYKMANKYFIPTGNLYQCKEGTPISADCDLLKMVLDNQAELDKPKKDSRETQDCNKKDYSEDPPEYTAARVKEWFRIIIPYMISYEEWLSIMTAARQLPQFITYERIDEWNQLDSTRYNAEKNAYKWHKLDNMPSFGLHTLHNIAKKFGYVESDFLNNWLDKHPQFDYRHKQIDAQEDFKGLEKPAAQVEKTPNNESESEKTALPDDLLNAIFSADITDYGNALRLWAVCKDKLRFSYDIDKWMSYDGHIWEVCNGDSIIFYHAQTLIKMLRENAGKSKERRKIATMMASESKIAHTKRHLKGLHSARITQKDLDKYPFLLNCQNGVVDLESGKLYPADATKYLTQIVNAEYRADYHNDIVDQFLVDIMPDDSTRAGLLCFLGYCLTGDVSQDKSLFLSGSGGNGKSTLLETLIYLLGSYSTVIPSQVLTLQKFDNGESATPALVSLKSARLAISDEIQDNQRLDVQKFKLLTGGNVFKARNLYEKATNIQPTHKLIICGNSDLQLQNVFDAGLQRRLMRIIFNQSFTGEKLNTRLRTQLLEKDNLDALLSLLVKNSMKYLTIGRLIESDAMILAKQEYLQDNDFIGPFLENNTADDDNSRIALQDIINRIKYRCPKDTSFLNDRTLRTMIRQALNSYKDDNGKPKYTEIKSHSAVYFQGLKWTKDF